MNDKKPSQTEAFIQLLERLAGQRLADDVRARIHFPLEKDIESYLELWIRYQHGAAGLPSWVSGSNALEAAVRMVEVAAAGGLFELPEPAAEDGPEHPARVSTPVPAVGMPVTIHVGSDRYAGAISWVATNQREVEVKMKRALRSDSVLTARLGRKGWQVTAGSLKDSKIVLGEARPFLDPSF